MEDRVAAPHDLRLHSAGPDETRVDRHLGFPQALCVQRVRFAPREPFEALPGRHVFEHEHVHHHEPLVRSVRHALKRAEIGEHVDFVHVEGGVLESGHRHGRASFGAATRGHRGQQGNGAKKSKSLRLIVLAPILPIVYEGKAHDSPSNTKPTLRTLCAHRLARAELDGSTVLRRVERLQHLLVRPAADRRNATKKLVNGTTVTLPVNGGLL